MKLQHFGLLFRDVEEEVAVGIKLDLQLEVASEKHVTAAWYFLFVLLQINTSDSLYSQASLNIAMICFPLMQ